MRKISPYKFVWVLFVFIEFVGIKCFAQVNDSSRWNVSADVIYSQKYYINNYLGQLNTFNNISFGGNPRFIGVQISGTVENHVRWRFFKYKSISTTFSQMIPCDIKINDSIKAKLSGVNFSFPFFGCDFFPKQKIVDLIFIIGANTGRLRLYNSDLVKSKNPYFSPKITLLPRFTFNKFVLSFLAEYDYDVTSSKWKKMKFGSEYKISPLGFNQSCYSFTIGLGYRFNKLN